MRAAKVVKPLQELQICQLEIESQNEELRKTRTDLIEPRDRYTELSAFAAVGYLILDVGGLIAEANPATVEMLEVPLTAIIGKNS